MTRARKVFSMRANGRQYRIIERPESDKLHSDETFLIQTRALAMRFRTVDMTETESGAFYKLCYLLKDEFEGRLK